ncbi:MAG: hypothetical protein WCC10_13265 [Tumebacillaceae bacterium]
MKKFVSTAISVFFFSTMLMLPASAAIHSNVPQDVEKFAQSEGLAQAKKMLSIVPADVGLQNVEEVGTLTLGPGLQENMIDWEKLKKSELSSMMSMLKPLQSWDFIIEKDGKPLTSMIVSKRDGKFYVSRIGGKTEAFNQAWNVFDVGTNEVQPTLVVDKNIRYLVGKHKEQEVAVPELTEERAASLKNMSNKKLWPAADIVKTLKDQEEAAAAQNQSGTSGGSGSLSAKPASKDSNFPFIPVAAGLLGILGIGAYTVRKQTNK